MENKSSLFKKLIIGFALILLILFFMSQKKASAFAIKGTESQPSMVDSERKHEYSYNAGKYQAWYSTHFSSTYTINNDYDLVAFKIIRLNTTLQLSSYNSTELNGYYEQPDIHNGTIDYYGNLNLHLNMSNFYQIGNGTFLTVFGYMGTNEGNVACFTTADYDNYVFCPIHRGLQINQFWLELAIDVPDYNRLRIDYEVRSERTYFNYDNTTIVQSQQQIEQSITGTDTTGASSGGLNDINSGASSLNSQLDSIVSVNNFSTIFTTFFTQIDNSTCSPLSLPFPFTNENIVLPCLGTEFQNRIPVIWALYTTIITGVIVLRFWRFYIDMFKHLLDPYSTGLHGVSDIAGGGK